jgi:hypothetical protein
MPRLPPGATAIAGILRAYGRSDGLLDHPLNRVSSRGGFENLADTGHRYRVHDIVLLRPSRTLRDALLSECAQFVRRYPRTGFQRDVADRQFAGIFVGLADCGCVRNRGMLPDHFLDQTGINVVPAADDEVLCAAGNVVHFPTADRARGDERAEDDGGDQHQSARATRPIALGEFYFRLEECRARPEPAAQRRSGGAHHHPRVRHGPALRLRPCPPARTRLAFHHLLFHGDNHRSGAALSLSPVFHLRETRPRQFDPGRGTDLHGDVLAVLDLPAAHLRPLDPLALEEGSEVDGATAWQKFYYVILPMMRPGLLTVAIIVDLNAWNEFVIAVTFLQNNDNVTAIVKFYSLTGQYSTDWGEMLAAAVIIVLPVVLVFVLLQRRFIDGMTAGAVKA